MEETALHCGPSGLSHDMWEQAVRPGTRPRGFHIVDLLAKHFDAVEISSSFSEFLKPEVTRVWARRAERAPKFQFTVKLHRNFTHERRVDPGEVRQVIEALEPLDHSGRLGCVLMQFPWSFRYTKENRAYLIQLRRAFHRFPLVAEMRHASWMLDEAIGTFIDYRVGFCNIDQPVYTKAMPPTSFLTSPIGYVRLHGKNCFNWYGGDDRSKPASRYDYLYSESELAEWTRRIDQIRGYAAKTFVIANNGSAGQAIANAMQLKSMLAGNAASLSREMAAQLRKSVTPQAALFTSYHTRAVA